jgi:sortase A
MNKFIYKKSKKGNIKTIIRFTGLGFSLLGIIISSYTFFPLLSWEVYLKPAFANQSVASPIPKTNIITKEQIQSLIKSRASYFNGKDYTKAQNWLPMTYKEMQVASQLSSYNLSIPKINIEDAEVSTIDTDLAKHLIHFPGTTTPPNKGNAVVFGHSTLPQLYNPKDYKTIFANMLDVSVGNTIIITINNTLYTYKIYNISIVDAEDTSYLTQEYDNSYLTIVTCTPPGTTWKRLIIKAKLETM